MKTQMKALTAVFGACMMLVSGVSVADSNYGYNTSAPAATAVSANASLNITINIPKLLVLRVGTANAIDTLTFTGVPSIATTPNPVATTGNNQAADWDASAPSFGVNTLGAVSAYLWHNNATAGASLSCSATGFTGGLTSADVTVTAGAGLAHPGGTTACAAPLTALARNTVHTGSWTYAANASAFAGAAPGAHTEVVTYTATTL